MLLEPGPLALFTAEEIPQAGDPSALEALAVDQVAALEGTATTIGLELLTMAGAGENDLERDGALDLVAAVDEHDRQSHDTDSSIAGVAASTDVLEGELAGLSSELAGDLKVDVPGEPVIPPDGYGRGDVPEETPRTQWDAIVQQQFRAIAGRVPSSAELVYARGFEPDLDALRAWIRAGAPMPPAPAPPAPPPGAPDWPTWDAAVHAIFQEIGQRDAFDGELNYTHLYLYPNLDAVRPWVVAGAPM